LYFEGDNHINVRDHVILLRIELNLSV